MNLIHACVKAERRLCVCQGGCSKVVELGPIAPNKCSNWVQFGSTKCPNWVKLGCPKGFFGKGFGRGGRVLGVWEEGRWGLGRGWWGEGEEEGEGEKEAVLVGGENGKLGTISEVFHNTTSQDR